uniref:Uncharacterized protein n=1 Tax=Rhizophora mucronata TaxID=61149 RepID=A0A2P2J619_RHIMU
MTIHDKGLSSNQRCQYNSTYRRKPFPFHFVHQRSWNIRNQLHCIYW